MSKTPCSRLPPRFLLVLAALIVLLPGCATTDADLDYTRQKAPDTSNGDHSYHGWNNANYDGQVLTRRTDQRQLWRARKTGLKTVTLD